MIKLIASDLDGTALYNGHLLEGNKVAIQKAIDSGIEFVVVTGRGLSAVIDDFYELNGFTYAITSNGASVTNVRTKERISHFTLSEEYSKKLLEIGKANGATFEVFVEGRGHVSSSYYEDPVSYGMPERIVPYIRYSRTPVDSIEDYIIHNINQIENFVFVVKDENMHKRVAEDVRELCHDTFVVDCDPQWVEVMNSSCSKGNALGILSNYLGINRNEIAAIGDGDNDIEMLQYAGLSVAMGNASARLKSIADFITTNAEKCGLAYAAEEIINGRWNVDSREEK